METNAMGVEAEVEAADAEASADVEPAEADEVEE